MLKQDNSKIVVKDVAVKCIANEKKAKELSSKQKDEIYKKEQEDYRKRKAELIERAKKAALAAKK